jgi:hypothetical protein
MDKLEIREIVLESASDEAPSRLEPSSSPAPPKSAEIGLPSVIVGRIAAILESGAPLVDFPGNESGNLISARSLVALNTADAGRDVALTFEGGDQSLPIIMGVVQTSPPAAGTRPVEVRLDDDSLTLSAKREIVLQCGKSSITLTSAGKVLIRGAYLLSRSSGVNRIKGGSVQIN